MAERRDETLMGFGKSDSGQRLFDLLERLGMSLREWASHDTVQQRYLMSAHGERVRREDEKNQEAERRAKRAR